MSCFQSIQALAVFPFTSRAPDGETAELSKEVPRDGLRDRGDGGRRSVDWSLPPMHLADETLDSQVVCTPPHPS
jgi:hypothetical protein